MINMSTLTIAAETLLQDAVTAGTIAATISRGQRINFDPGQCPWVGIYPGSVSTTPKTLGAGSNRWSNSATLQVVVQTASLTDDGQEASDDLETLVAGVLGVVNADLTLGVAAARVMQIEREYKYVIMDDDGAGSVFMPQCIIKLGLEVRSA